MSDVVKVRDDLKEFKTLPDKNTRQIHLLAIRCLNQRWAGPIVDYKLLKARASECLCINFGNCLSLEEMEIM